MDEEYIKYIKSRAGLMYSRCQKGLKPVWRTEKPMEMAAIENLLADDGIKRFKSYKIRERDGKYELFLGNDPRRLESAVKYTDIAESPHVKEIEKVEEAIEEIGVLLGYPRCCARKFAKDRVAVRGLDDIFHNLLVLKRRIEFGDRRVPKHMNPFFGELDFVPCRLDCKAAMETMRKRMCRTGILRKILGAAVDFVFRREAGDIFLFLLDGSECVSASPANPALKGRIKYIRPKAVNSGSLLAPFFRGDFLEIGPGWTKIFNSEGEISRFGSELAAWHREKCFFPEFWKDYAEKMIEKNARKF